MGTSYILLKEYWPDDGNLNDNGVIEIWCLYFIIFPSVSRSDQEKSIDNNFYTKRLLHTLFVTVTHSFLNHLYLLLHKWQLYEER